MKKAFMVVLLCGFCITAFAQVGETGVKPESTTPASPAMEALQTAYSLAKYGYSNLSASALIGAAEILAQIQTQALGSKVEEKGQTRDSGTKTEKPEFTAANLLAEGKKLAAGDATMLAWAAQVEAALKTKTRGAAGGPRYDYVKIAANATINCRMRFTANQLAEVLVAGDGSTVLDLYIYDQNGNLVAWDERYSDDCYVNWVPRWTGDFTIVVKNRGNVYNRFEIATN